MTVLATNWEMNRKNQENSKMKMSNKKKILFSLLVIILLYILWLGFHLIRFKTYKSPSEVISPLEIEGVYHIHTQFSDGRKTPDEIAKLAGRSSLNFIILTDHGNPNFESLASQGWKQGVLVLAGSEISVSRGHLVALGFEKPAVRFAQNTEIAVHQVKALNGFSIIAHPYSKTRWSWGKQLDNSGIEIINGDTMLKRNLLFSLPFFPALFIKPDYALLKMLDSPEKNLQKWDRLNKIQSIYGYFSTDAHLLYRPLLSFLHLHVLLENPLSEDFETAKNQVFNALKQGKFYNAVDSAAKANGFRFWGKKEEKIIKMGSQSSLDLPVTLSIEAPFPFAKEILLIHNGQKILQFSEEMTSFEADLPGFYRVEVYLRERSPLKKNIPWIVSNPIFLREKKQ